MVLSYSDYSIVNTINFGYVTEDTYATASFCFLIFVLVFKLFMLLDRIDVRITATKHNERLMCEVDFKKV